MRKKNPFLFFMSFIILLLLATMLGAKLYKSQNHNEVLFNSIKSMTNYEHSGQLNLLTMGDAATFDHHDITVKYDYKKEPINVVFDNNLNNESNEHRSWTSVKLLYDIINIAPDSLSDVINNNYLYIKGQLENDLNFNFEGDHAKVTFTLEEGYTAFVNILELLSKDEAFEESLLYLFNNYCDDSNKHTQKNRLFKILIALNDNFEINSTESFNGFYNDLISTFSKDSVITIEFRLNNKQLHQIKFQGNFNYNSFQASELMEWLIEFE